MEVLSHDFCHILIVREKSIVPIHTQGERITYGHEYQEVCIMEAILDVYFHLAVLVEA